MNFALRGTAGVMAMLMSAPSTTEMLSFRNILFLNTGKPA